MKVLVVEDQTDVVDFIEKALRQERMLVSVAYTGEEALRKFRQERPDVILLDINLPGKNGFEVCKCIRASGSPVPIIMLTARDTLDDKVAGLDAGADDYLCKPFLLAELMARIRAVSRRKQQYTGATLTAGDLLLEPEAHAVSRKGRDIELSVTEFKLLRYLIEHKGKIVSKANILEQVWEYDFDPGTNIVEVYIKFLRNKIDKGHSRKMIRTVRGVGYKLCV